MLKFIVSILTAVAMLTSLLAATSESSNIKLLIIEGVSNHDWHHRLALVKEILARDGSFEVEVSITPAAADDPAWKTWNPDFSAHDVVLSGYNNLGGKPPWPEGVRKSFSNFIANGGGFYCYHEANNAFAEWPEYNRIIGLGWRKMDFGKAVVIQPDETLRFIPPGEGTNTGHGPRLDVTVHQFGDHPIHRGLPRSWMAAEIEIYHYARGPAEDLNVIAYAKEPKSQLQFPIEWTVQYGKGRVFVSTYGHVWVNQPDPKGMKCAAFQTIMIRALKWLANRDPGQECPADFPSADKVSLRK